MNFRIASVIAAVSTGFFASHAMAATVVLDSFDDEQIAVDVPYPGTSSSSTIAFGSGTRTLEAENTSGPSPVSATVLESVGGALRFSNKDEATGRATLSYTALGDISLGLNPYLYFDVGYFDNIANFSVSATDGDGNVSTYTEVLSSGFSPTLFFSAFTGSADFNDIALLSFTLDTTNVPGYGPVVSVDGSLNSILLGYDQPAPIPLPATAVLLLAGVGGLGGLRALVRRKSA